MAVTVGTSKVSAGLTLVTVHGTLAEVRAELATGATAGNYKYKWHMKHWLNWAMSNTATTVNATGAMYLVDVSDVAGP